jgi:hypothetical protein
MMNLKVGTKIWNNGDMANREHFGEIVDVLNRGGIVEYKIVELICDEEKAYMETSGDKRTARTYWIHAAMFSEEFKGHSGTRFVTAAEYVRYREAGMAAFRAKYGNTEGVYK